MQKGLTTGIILLMAFISQAQYTWTVKDSFPGTPRRTAAGFSINGMGYVVGGNTALSPVTNVNDVWQYDPTTDSWTQKSNFPYATSGPAFFSINNVAYVVGGAAGTSTNSAYNAGTDSWLNKTAFPENGVAGPFQFVMNGLAYVGTGERTGSNTSNTMYSYNPVSDSWAQTANFPGHSIVGGVAFSIDSLGYVGSGTDGGGNYFNQFYSYNPGSNTWAPIAPFPGKARNGAISFVLNGKAYVGGGVSLSGSNAYSLGDFYQYDPATNVWSAIPGFPGNPRQNATSFIINNVGYAVAGLNDDGQVFYNVVNEFGTCGNITGILPVGGGNSKSAIEISPNPSGTEVNVKIGNEVKSEVKYQVISIDGKLIKSGTTLQNIFGFSASNLSNGVYILTLTDNHGIQGEERFEVIH